MACTQLREGEAPAEPRLLQETRLGRSLALPQEPRLPNRAIACTAPVEATPASRRREASICVRFAAAPQPRRRRRLYMRFPWPSQWAHYFFKCDAAAHGTMEEI